MEGPRCQLAPYRALSLQSSSQDILQELFKGPGHSIYQVRVQVHQDPDTVPSWSEVRAGHKGHPTQPSDMTTEDPEHRLKSQALSLSTLDLYPSPPTSR